MFYDNYQKNINEDNKNNFLLELHKIMLIYFFAQKQNIDLNIFITRSYIFYDIKKTEKILFGKM